MKNELKVFNNVKFGEVQIILIDGKEYFGATNVAKVLGYKNPNDAILRHCRKDGIVKHEVIDSLGRKQELNLITEGNLYRLIAKSKLPQAEEFETWVFDEILPSLRKNGTYSIQTTNVNDNLTVLVQNTMKAILPVITQEMGKVVLESKETVNNIAGLIHDQAEMYDSDRENLKELIGFRCVNTTRMTRTIKEKLSDKLGYNVKANNEIYIKVKNAIFKEFKVIKWEDIPVEKYNKVFAFVDTYIEEM